MSTMWTMPLLLLSCLLTLSAVRCHIVPDINGPTGLLTHTPVPSPMKPFWASTGLCPPEPRNTSEAFLLSPDSLMNLELIAALTPRGITHVRIHWLIDLLKVSKEGEQYRYNFTALDTLLDHLHGLGLYPGFEVMGTPLNHAGMRTKYLPRFWTDLVQQLVTRYEDRYGPQYVVRWRFETWNEPDLQNYNLLNFNVTDYLNYIFAVRAGLDAMNGKLDRTEVPGKRKYRLYGPAGLFRAEKNHPFCWSVMNLCNAHADRRCPFDTITFHRKGTGRWASEVVDGGSELVSDLLKRFDHVSHHRFANDEADPVAGWSTVRPFQADVRYAAMLFSIVTQHWSAITDGTELGRRLQFLSHDNAFLSYYPYVFEQRTLLARFQMNVTDPPHVQFVVKPAFCALGMLANTGSLALPTHHREGNVSYVMTYGKRTDYVCLLASRSNDSEPLWVQRTYFNVSIPLAMLFRVRGPQRKTTRVGFLVEAIEAGRNDPFRVWKMQGKPAYPSTGQLAALRAVQLPSILTNGTRLVELGNMTNITLSLNLRGPWIVSVRVCREDQAHSATVHGLRVRTVYRNEVLVHWKSHQSGDSRCVQTYEVWFKSSPTSKVECPWYPINVSQHTPFRFYHYASNNSIPSGEGDELQREACSGVGGYYKVRAIDLFGRSGKFSSAVHYNISGPSVVRKV